MAYRGMKGSTNNAFDSYVERQNDDNVELLSEKVNTLKRFAISIGDEVRDQNRYIDSMGSDFDSNFGFLSGVMGKLKHVQKAGGHKMLLYLIGFALLVFFIIYCLAR